MHHKFNVKMRKKVVIANNDGLARLKAIELVHEGRYTLAAIGKMFGVHYTTISEWVKMYDEGGIARLNTYRKPRPKHLLVSAEIEKQIKTCESMYKNRLRRLLRMAIGLENDESLMYIAKKEGVSVQTLMKDRRLYESGYLTTSQ